MRHSEWEVLLLCLLIATWITLPLTIYASSSKFDWLEPGAYAVYSFNSLHPRKGYLCSSAIGFDDCGYGRAVGNYTWRCLEVNGSRARIEVEVNLFFEYGVVFWGKEFAERAKNDDLSFVKRIPWEQTSGEIYITGDQFEIWGPIDFQKSLVVTVNLDTLELVDEEGEPWGKWVMWIDPLKYPLKGETEETFIMNWLNTTVALNLGYRGENSMNTVFGRVDGYFSASRFEPFENAFLLKLYKGQPTVLFTYAYEPRSGILIAQITATYLDDVLTQKFGIIATSGGWRFTLTETNISVELGNGGFDLSSYAPYFAVLGIVAVVVGTVSYKVFRKRETKHNAQRGV